MTTIPKSFIGRLQFFEQRLPAWQKDPSAIGLESADLDTLSDLVAGARARYEEMHAIRNAAEAATLRQSEANGAMFEYGSDLVKTIRACAQRTDDPGVYAAALIPPPKEPSPTGAPPAAKNLRFELLTTGELRLSWEGTTARGAYFVIHRKAPAEESYRLLATVAAKTFVDRTIPPGATPLRYYIEARRGRHSVNGAATAVQFGGGGLAGVRAAA